MQYLSRCLLFGAALWAVSGAQVPVSGLNTEEFLKENKDLNWGENPFARPTEDIHVGRLNLFAIVYRPDDRAALIERNVVRMGDKVGTNEVVSISQREVVLRGTAGTFTLTLPGGSIPFAKGSNYSIIVENAPVIDIARLFAVMQHKNIVVSNQIVDTVTASFPSIGLNAGFQAILKSKNLGLEDEHGVVSVYSQKDFEASGKDLQTVTFPIKFATAKNITEQVRGLLSPRGTVTVDDRTNSITAKDTQAGINNVTKLLSSIDTVDRQVLIEARLVEANSDFLRAMGVQWGASGRFGPVSFGGPANGTPAAVGGTAGGAIAAAPGNFIHSTPAGNPLSVLTLGLAPIFGGVNLDLQLSAGEQEGKLAVLSRPSIVTMNNRPATITSGINFYVKSAGNLGVTTGGALGGGTNLQTISSGVTMSVTPQITADNKIYLVINVTSSQPNFAQSVDGIPTVSNNNATTSVLLSDGETTIIAGMFQLQDSMSDVGMPFLRSIPIIGRLFGSSSNTRKKKELVVFIKPSIVAQALKELGKTDLTDEEEAVIQRTLKGGEKLRFERL